MKLFHCPESLSGKRVSQANLPGDAGGDTHFSDKKNRCWDIEWHDSGWWAVHMRGHTCTQLPAEAATFWSARSSIGRVGKCLKSFERAVKVFKRFFKKLHEKF